MTHTGRIAACLFLICTAGPLFAGAWQREPGTGFASLTQRLSWPQDTTTWQSYEPTARYTSLYLEYGIAPRTTLGLDLGLSVSGAEKLVVFAQRPLRQADPGPRLAYEIGFGRIAGQTVLRPGLSLGLGWNKGWFAADAIAEIPLSFDATDIKIDLTLGRNLPKDHKLILQLQTGDTEMDPPFVRLETSVSRPLLGRFPRLKAETGVSIGLVNDDSMGVKFGLVTSF